eukprot:TRINITY_DN22254_c0_g1_i2.p1 TRINITY_DN22254_c0_g1~~TRINITY_DN22254_c0_g1_i2.p1  ORF type:complete len:675 (-),score=63.16 TRINITY_DN22254_c0_g1_i2:268-2292(-)
MHNPLLHDGGIASSAPSAPPLPALASADDITRLTAVLRKEASNGHEAQMRAMRIQLDGKVIHQGHVADILQSIDASHRAQTLRELYERQMLIDSDQAGPPFEVALGDAGALGLSQDEAAAMRAQMHATAEQALRFLPPGSAAPSAPPSNALPSAPPADFSDPTPSAPSLNALGAEHAIILIHYDGKVISVVGDASALTLSDVFRVGGDHFGLPPFDASRHYAFMVWPGRCRLADFDAPVAAMGISSWSRVLWLKLPTPSNDQKPADPRTAGLRFQQVQSTFFSVCQTDGMNISRGELLNFFWNMNLDDAAFSRLWQRLDTRSRGFLDIDDMLHLVGRAHMQHPQVPLEALLYEAASLIVYGGPAEMQTHFDTSVAEAPRGIGCKEAIKQHGCSYFVSLVLQMAVPLLLILQVIEMSAGVSESDYKLQVAAVLYCLYLVQAFCCTRFSSAVGNRITGLDAVCNRLELPKTENPTYRWHIQCYHYETRTRQESYTDSNGNRQTRTVTETHRVNTWSSSRTGTIPSIDATPVFVPNTRALVTEIDTSLDLDFSQSNYLQCYRHWCLANRFDIHADESRTEDLPSRKPGFLAEWVNGARPCWMRRLTYVFSTLLMCSMCFRLVVQSRVGLQNFTYKKRCFRIDYSPPGRCHHGAAAFLGGLTTGITIASALGSGGYVW